MKLIIGLGNPGTKYQNTWHNLGFLVLDEFFIRHEGEFKTPKLKTKFKAGISEGLINDEKIILAKPQTFMNLSGESAQALADFFEVDSKDVWIIHDDVDIELGNLKISQNSSSGGHKGIDSIIQHLGNREFARFRVGINQDQKAPTEKYVLQKINNQDTVNEVITRTAQALELALTDGITKAMNKFN